MKNGVYSTTELKIMFKRYKKLGGIKTWCDFVKKVKGGKEL